MKVRIENKSSAAITVKGRHTLRIPAEGVLETTMADTPQANKTLSRLHREYPALKITVAKDGDEKGAGEDNGKQVQPNDPPSKPEPENTSVPENENALLPAAPMEREAFIALAKASKGSGDKWNVAVEGVKTFKVKDAADESAAIELAYSAYLESFSATNAE